MNAAVRLDPIELAPGMLPNPGFCPQSMRDKRVVVQLANGRICGREQVTSTTPTGWAADGRQGCRWTLTGDPFDIVGWQVAK